VKLSNKAFIFLSFAILVMCLVACTPTMLMRQEDLEDLDAEIDLALSAKDYSRARVALERYPSFAKKYKNPLYFGKERNWDRRVKHYKVLLAVLPLFEGDASYALRQLEVLPEADYVHWEKEWYRSSVLANLGYLKVATEVLRKSCFQFGPEENPYFFKWMMLMGRPVWLPEKDIDLDASIEAASALSEAAVLVWNGKALLERGHAEKAVDSAHRALEMAKQIKPVRRIGGGHAIELNILGIKEKPGRAIAFQARILEGECQLNTGEAEKAAKAASEAEILAHDTGRSYSAVVEAYALRALAEAQSGHRDVAIRYCQAVEKYLDQVYDENVRFKVCFYLGRAYWRLGDRGDGVRWLRESIDTAERIQTAIMPLGMRAEFYSNWRSAYQTLVSMLMESGEPEKAFPVAERGRNRALLDKLTRGGIQTQVDVRYHELKIEASYLRSRLAFATQDPKDMEKSEKELIRLETEMAQELARLAQLKKSSPLHLGDVSGVQARLGEGEVLMVYQLLAEEGIVWVLGTDFFLHATLPPEEAISTRCRSLHASIGDPSKALSGDNTWEEPAVWLYDMLIRPLKERCALGQKWIVVPDGDLLGIPFEVLIEDRDKGKCVIDSTEVVYAPSVSIFKYFRTLSKGERQERILLASVSTIPNIDSSPVDTQTRGLTLGDLPFVDFEAEAIHAIYGKEMTTWLRDKEASEKQFKAQFLSDFGTLHFACHAVMPSDTPWLSEAALIMGTSGEEYTEDGLLMANEVEQLNVGADLVVLSACDTAGGRFIQGSGFIGLASSFIAAGARSVLVSQWEVEDRSTGLLMKKFHEMVKAGNSTTESLRDAKLWMRQHAILQEKTRGILLKASPGPALSAQGKVSGAGGHPFYWAPFVLVGMPGDVLFPNER
jgi:CHAT domain-containing protein/tetratricopeptide (TPR) repeat protein